MTDFIDAAMESKAWPFEEARKLLKRYEDGPPEKGHVLFSTGYGPSGLPHIGTFGEVARTTMVRRAFEAISDIPTRLICFSDDLDGMRKVPGNVPQQDMLAEHLHRPLTDVPDPFGEHESFGHHNNAMLRRFLDRFGFEYEFVSARDFYRSGRFDAVLRRAAERYDDVMKVMLRSLREERAETYSIFLPIHPETGRVLYVPMKHVDAAEGTVTFDDEAGREWTLPVTGGNVKLQWKPDFGMRWAALGVDYEMFGKDHQANMPIYDRICSILGGRPPEHFVYELFLDGEGQKISKSKGNGLTIDEWLAYAPSESLAFYNFLKPRTAKRLYFDVIPKAVDDYHQNLAAYGTQDAGKRVENPVFHIHSGEVPTDAASPVPFALLLKLVSASNARNPDVLWGFIGRYHAGVTADTHPQLDALVRHAIRYYEDFVAPKKEYGVPDATEREALAALDAYLAALPNDVDAAIVQDAVLDAGRGFDRYIDPAKLGPTGKPAVTRAWFAALYKLLMGEESGPRFGTFAALYGIDNTRALIAEALARQG
ncbi:MAG: lysine--tRNA ligase [Shimia sp.]